jgi:hypothetical protein
MRHSHTAAVLFALLPALTTARPWFRREAPSTSISENVPTTAVPNTSGDTLVITTQVHGGDVTQSMNSNSSASAIESLPILAFLSVNSAATSSPTTSAAVTSAAVTSAAATSAAVTSAATSAAYTPAYCGPEHLPTLKSHAMIMTGKDISLDVSFIILFMNT